VTDVLGLDVAGIVEQVASDVVSPRVGDRICALVAGGGYADYCTVPAVQCMPIPSGLTFADAAGLPEVMFTAWNNVIRLGRLSSTDTLLVQGGTSGVGMAAIQIAKVWRGARVFATAGTAEKLQVCLDIGADAAVSYHGAWDEEIRRLTDGRGVDLILDSQAGPYTNRELDLLTFDGRLVLIATHLGVNADINLRQIVHRRLTLAGSTLRTRTPEYKQGIAQELVGQIWPLIERREIKIPICAVFPLEDVAKAHALMDANEQIGKVILILESDLALTS
jgi:NADPH2:quinone reductase